VFQESAPQTPFDDWELTGERKERIVRLYLSLSHWYFQFADPLVIRRNVNKEGRVQLLCVSTY
jgi:hypothetical protein